MCMHRYSGAYWAFRGDQTEPGDSADVYGVSVWFRDGPLPLWHCRHLAEDYCGSLPGSQEGITWGLLLLLLASIASPCLSQQRSFSARTHTHTRNSYCGTRTRNQDINSSPKLVTIIMPFSHLWYSQYIWEVPLCCGPSTHVLISTRARLNSSLIQRFWKLTLQSTIQTDSVGHHYKLDLPCLKSQFVYVHGNAWISHVENWLSNTELHNRLSGDS